jgi:hypothetical protein
MIPPIVMLKPPPLTVVSRKKPVSMLKAGAANAGEATSVFSFLLRVAWTVFRPVSGLYFP